MEVRRFGQGRQMNLDIANKSTDVVNNNGQNTLQEVTKTADYKVNATRESMDTNLNEDEVKKAVEKLNKLLEDEQTHAVYEVHETFKKDVMIKIVDNNTKEVVLEVPPKKILDMVAKMMEMVGLLVDEKA